jgi:hypothetical protein
MVSVEMREVRQPSTFLVDLDLHVAAPGSADVLPDLWSNSRHICSALGGPAPR